MDDILRDIPDRIESRRLILRSPMPGDGAAVHAGVLATLAQLRAFPASMPWAMAELRSTPRKSSAGKAASITWPARDCRCCCF